MDRSKAGLFPLTIFFLCLASPFTRAQDAAKPGGESCLSTTVASVPSRPSVSNGADTTQCGVVEVEYGLERQWPGGGAHRDDLSGGLRFGLTPDLDFHWQSGAFLHVMNGDGNRTGFGDTWLGVKYHFLNQTKNLPGLGFFYQVKVPSASTALGLGSGQVDHSFSFLVSKDLRGTHVDFNVIPFLAGRAATSGFDRNVGLALSASRPLVRGLGVIGEGYGYTSLNQDNPAFASTMAGVTYQVNPRLVLDAGFDVGVTHGAPKNRVFVGVTYAVANMYAWARRSD